MARPIKRPRLRTGTPILKKKRKTAMPRDAEGRSRAQKRLRS